LHVSIPALTFPNVTIEEHEVRYRAWRDVDAQEFMPADEWTEPVIAGRGAAPCPTPGTRRMARPRGGREPRAENHAPRDWQCPAVAL